MENGFNKDIKHGVIVLSDIKEVKKYGVFEYFRDKDNDDDDLESCNKCGGRFFCNILLLLY